MMSLLPRIQCEKDQNTILILIVLATIKYYAIDWYKKILYRTLLLGRDYHIIELLLNNYLRYIQELI